MPTPGKQAPWQQAMPNTLKKILEQGEPDLAHEVAELRKEIAALRSELAPVPSLIVTGRQALDEFKRLAHAAPNTCWMALGRSDCPSISWWNG